MPYLNKIWYDLYEGKKPVLIFIHGYAINSSVWNSQIEFFKNNKRIILELRGYGKSLDDAPDKLKSYCEDILDIMKKEKIKNAILIGHSLGCTISLLFWRLFPEKIRKLILINPYIDRRQLKFLPKLSLKMLMLLPFLPNFYIKHKNISFLKLKCLLSTKLRTLKKTKEFFKDYNFNLPKNTLIINSINDEILEPYFKDAVFVKGSHVLQLSNPNQLNKIIKNNLKLSS